VAATRGQVLLFDGGLLDAVFHSSSGGASTENSGEIWNQQLPYLVSVPDLDDLSPVQNWQQTLSPELLRKAFGEIGGALRIEVLTTSASGRIRQARVTGPAGTLLVSGTQLRSRLGLRSTLVRFESLTLDPAAQPTWTMLPSSLKLAPNNMISGSKIPGNAIPGNTALGYAALDNAALGNTISGNMITGNNNSASLVSMLPPPPLLPAIEPEPLQLTPPTLLAIGRGFGHGVGMSQWGAYGLARRGEDYQRILLHYYRGSELRPYAAALVSP
jgi:stage II sporulation protein D